MVHLHFNHGRTVTFNVIGELVEYGIWNIEITDQVMKIRMTPHGNLGTTIL